MPTSIKGKVGRTLGAITLLATMGLGLVGCGELESENPYRNITGSVYSITQQELIYTRLSDFGNTSLIPVPVTFLGIESQGEKYDFILAGPHNIKHGDALELVYLVDTEVTGQDICDRFYTGCPRMTKPDVRFRVDGYVHSWDKE